MQDLKCKNCGASLNFSEAVNGIFKCKFCRQTFTVPKPDVHPDTLSFIRCGEHDLDTGKFDDAYSAFKKASEADSNEPEAFFGMALAEFKIMYLKDYVNNRLQPICFEASEKKFADNANYLRAIELASVAQRKQYESNCEEISVINRNFKLLKESGKQYDCFICVKVSSPDGGYTPDCLEAHKLYYHLKEQGFNPFFSEIDIKNKTGADYESVILYALKSSECMLIICSDEEYLKTDWVKNEYARFLKLVNDEEKENDGITIVFKGKPVETLPGKNGKIQGVDLLKPDAYSAIVKFVYEHTPEARAHRENEKRKKEQETEELKKQLEESRRAQEELDRKFRALSIAAASVSSLLKDADKELISAEFDKARELYKTVLDKEPNNAYALWGMFLCSFKVVHEHRLYDNIPLADSILANSYFKSAFRNAVNTDLYNRINDLYNNIKENKSKERAELKAKYILAIKRGLKKHKKIYISLISVFCALIIGIGISIPVYKHINAGVRVHYELNADGGYTLKSVRPNKDVKTFSVPSIYAGKPVTRIEATFKDWESLESVIIPDGVKTIGYNAFYRCTSLKSVHIAESVTEIGNSAFDSCTSLSEISIPYKVKLIGGSAFFNCISLKSIVIPENTYYIGPYAFSCCYSLKIKCCSTSKPVGWADSWNGSCNVEWGYR